MRRQARDWNQERIYGSGKRSAPIRPTETFGIRMPDSIIRPTACSFRLHFILLLFAPIVSNPSNAYFLYLQAYVISNDDGLYLCLPINRAGLPSRHHDQIPQLHGAYKQKCRKTVRVQQTKYRHISLLRLLYLPVAIFSCAHYWQFHTRQDYSFANHPADFLLLGSWSPPSLSLWVGH